MAREMLSIIDLAKHLARACPKCKDYLGVGVPEPPEPMKEIPMEAHCVWRGFRLPWKIVLGNKRVGAKGKGSGKKALGKRPIGERVFDSFLPNVLRPLGYTNAKRKDVTVGISSIVWGISLLFLGMLIMVDLQGCANQKWVSQKVTPIFSARACSCGPQSGCYRCYPLEGKPVVPPGTTQVSHDRPPVPPYTPPTPLITPRASLTAQSFHDSAKKGDLEKMKDLVQARPELVNAKDNLGDTALYHAVALGHKAVAEFLLAHRAAVNAKDNKGFTPLHAAAGTGRIDMVEVLLVNKADINAKDDGSWTPQSPCPLAASGLKKR